MKHIIFALCTFIGFFVLQFLSLHAISTTSNDRRASTLKFFNKFQGLQKGDKLKDVHALKKHLEALGYYDQFHLHDLDHDDNFDENLESAIKTYQINYNLKPAGVIDYKTMVTMSMPRCGVPDIVNGRTGMRSAGYNVSAGSNNFHMHYAFFPGNPRWPRDKLTITYAFLDPKTSQDAKESVGNAFKRWSGLTPYAYQYLPESDYGKADIKISFQRRDHGDGLPFDGAFHILAHAFAPTDGRFHYDADEKWVLGAVPGAIDMQSVALHEIGHNLGLAHSSDQAAIMYPIIPVGKTKDLNDDDMKGIRELYGRERIELSPEE